jgi:hypothetical protein
MMAVASFMIGESPCLSTNFQRTRFVP